MVGGEPLAERSKKSPLAMCTIEPKRSAKLKLSCVGLLPTGHEAATPTSAMPRPEMPKTSLTHTPVGAPHVPAPTPAAAPARAT